MTEFNGVPDMDDFPNLFDADDFHVLAVEAPRGVRFPAIYMGTRLDESRPVKYGASLFLTDLPPELWGQVNARTSLSDELVYVSAFGQRCPEVVPELRNGEQTVRGRTAELELLSRLDRLGARNLSTDKLFIETPLRLEVGGYRWGSEVGRVSSRMPDSVRRALEGKFLLTIERVFIQLKEGE